MTYDLEKIKEECAIIDEEINILQNVLMDTASRDAKYHPMITFFKNEKTRQVVVTPAPQQSFSNTLSKLAEALYLYPCLDSSCALISLDSIIKNSDNQEIDCLQLFLISEYRGYIIQLPYTKNQDKTITWHSDHFTTQNLLDTNFEGPTKDMINLFFMFTHLDSSPYTVHECLSYLSYSGASLQIFDSLKIAYYSAIHQ